MLLLEPSSAVCMTMLGCPGAGGCNSCDEPGVKFAKAASRSWLMRGSPSGWGCQSKGGDAGGEIKNCLNGAGSCRLLFLTGVTG